MSTVIHLAESGLLPDPAIRWAIRRLNDARLREQRRLDADGRAVERWAAQLRASRVTQHVEEANAQHYEVPTDFFRLVLGKRMKYSACHWPEHVTSLDAAEEAMLALSAERAGLADGQDVLDLGCGWGSMSLWLAERHPHSRILGVSNSRTQRAFIETEARRRGLTNLEIQTHDVSALQTNRSFDRVVSVEMFEHVRNWESLLGRVATWLRPDGSVFLHVFSHVRHAYPFEAEGARNWMGRHFFTGGQMPSHDLLPRFQRDLAVIEQWRESGVGYQRTSEAWLANLDRRHEDAVAVFRTGMDRVEAERVVQRWRIFFMACAELFGAADGSEWGVSHYRLARPEGGS